ncbi:MAG TPA: arginine--tRNA ligase [Lacipirellulaceae bacterium]|jgi:arginyl-tRNA synthetase
MNVLALLRDRFSKALREIGVETADLPTLLGMILSSQDAKFGDYQANLAMSLGKRLGKPPREIAQQLVAQLDGSDVLESPEIAGPGFINLRLKDDWIAAQLAAASSDLDRLGVEAVARPRTFVIDYSSPNVAKPMHVGHIRSTVIGDALYRVLKFLGHRTISDNHLGDWGTQFGMIIYGYKHFVDEQALAARPVEELSRLYKLVHALVDYRETLSGKIPTLKGQITDAEERRSKLEQLAAPADPKELKKAAKRLDQANQTVAELETELSGLQTKLAATETDAELGPLLAQHAEVDRAVLAETARLHSGDTTNVELWRRFLPPCLREIEATYERLGVTFDHTLGESFYHDRLRGVVKDLLDKGLARESEGAICVFIEGQQAPMIVQKQDGAFLYATTDLATIQYRMAEWRPDAILYVVDHRQSLHFEQLIAAVRLWGYRDVELQHVSFGTVLGEDGRPFKTRSGTSVGLTGLLDEAVERAYAIVCQNDDARPAPLLSEEERRQVAERIGIGAIKYADLAHNRTSDYVFSYDKMLAMTGNTAAYMQYSYARVRSIFGKSGVDESAIRNPQSAIAISLDTPQERALGLALLQFAETLTRVVADYRPNHLTAYLFELASRYSEFFEHCPVLKAETDDLRASRLLLCDLTARTIQRGLELLGINTVERM